MKKRSWLDKLTDSRDLPKIVELNEEGSRHFGGKTMVVPAPIDVYNLMAQVPEGKITNLNEIRKVLAKKYNTDIACPLTTGIFVWISSWASTEASEGSFIKPIAYWRTLKSNMELNGKYPGGVESQAERLKAEGIQIVQKRKKLKAICKENQFFGYDKFEIK